MNDRQYDIAAEEIIALVGENPPELFSLEYKFLFQELKAKLIRFYQVSEDELEGSYNVGYTEGYDEGWSAAEAEFDQSDTIQDLETEIEELQSELAEAEDKFDQAFAEGFQEGIQARRLND